MPKARQRRDKKIAQLEKEYQNLMLAGKPGNVARLCQIMSELATLWNSKVRDEQNDEPDNEKSSEKKSKPQHNTDKTTYDSQKQELKEDKHLKDKSQLENIVDEIVHDGKKRMTKAQSKEEINSAFKEGMDRIKSLIDDLAINRALPSK